MKSNGKEFEQNFIFQLNIQYTHSVNMLLFVRVKNTFNSKQDRSTVNLKIVLEKNEPSAAITKTVAFQACVFSL